MGKEIIVFNEKTKKFEKKLIKNDKFDYYIFVRNLFYYITIVIFILFYINIASYKIFLYFLILNGLISTFSFIFEIKNNKNDDKINKKKGVKYVK